MDAPSDSEYEGFIDYLFHQNSSTDGDAETSDAEIQTRYRMGRVICGYKIGEKEPSSAQVPWIQLVRDRLDILLLLELVDSTSFSAIRASIETLGIKALLAFMQSSVTGPPLPFSVEELVLPKYYRNDATRRHNVKSLAVDGVVAYPLIPDLPLFWLSKIIFDHPGILTSTSALEHKARVDFMHQRLLNEPVSSLESSIYTSLESGEEQLKDAAPQYTKNYIEFLLERATIHLYYGHDTKARADLERARELSGFEFVLTGLLGKRTKFQDRDLSQLVVLARSKPSDDHTTSTAHVESVKTATPDETTENAAKPKTLDLNDDTLLESIAYNKAANNLPKPIEDESALPESLKSLDPSAQPQLSPHDSIILLLLASSITNQSPADGLTREETLPYATRVLEGGSSNWQIYTQALLVRSRIEGYRARTVERGVLQLQALVDQIIADTQGKAAESATFLPRPKESESASAVERLFYVHMLCSPTRWELEAELAARWVSLGGLRTALEIYERLQMWAEVALCWAGVDQEDKGRKIIRKLLFHPINPAAKINEDFEMWEGEERSPLPADASRLFCILGDMDAEPAFYERAWEISEGRYSRAQRSLGRHYFARKQYDKAATAYKLSLRIQRNDQTTCFALGCCYLELAKWDFAADAFSRAVKLDDTDAESWSNLATSILKRKADSNHWPQGSPLPENTSLDDHIPDSDPEDPNRYKRDALHAFARAAALKRDSWKIWENVLLVAASLPSYPHVVTALTRIIDLRGPSIGDACIDADILARLVHHVTTSSSSSSSDNDPQPYNPTRPGLDRLVVQLVDTKVSPLISHNPALYRSVAALARWRNRPASALLAEEKAWRTLTRSGWADPADGDTQWKAVAQATLELVDAYESLGPMRDTEGVEAGEKLVAKDWRGKARSAIRSVLGRAEGFEETEEWGRLRDRLDGLKV